MTNPLDSLVTLVAQRSSWDQHDRDMAEWSIWTEVKADLRSYLPAQAPVPNAQVVGLSNLELREAKAQIAEDAKTAAAFGEWRAAVTLHEATNAGRLLCLGRLVVALVNARLRASKPEAVDQALAQLGDIVARHWGTDVPLRGDIRTWSSRVTRRADLLPFAWREI